jgi:hypothetical protein
MMMLGTFKALSKLGFSWCSLGFCRGFGKMMEVKMAAKTKTAEITNFILKYFLRN